MDSERQPLSIGQVLQGKYRIEQEIGRGGFGIIYRATTLPDGGEVAIKLLLPLGRHQSTDVRRFEREAQLVQRLDHPGVVTLHDYGHAAPHQPFMVFELLRGRSLAERLEAGETLQPLEVATLGVAVLEALKAAHELGIVHRDIKPENLVLPAKDAGDRVRVIDFGIAKTLWGEGANVTKLTQTGLIVGSPHYMAPEHARGQAVAPAVDLYSLGLVLAEALSGETVVTAEAPIDALMAQLDADTLPLPEAVLSTPLGPVIARAVQKATEVRYSTAAQMLADMRAVVRRMTGEPSDAGAGAVSRDAPSGQGTAFAPTVVPESDGEAVSALQPPATQASARSTAEASYVDQVLSSGSVPPAASGATGGQGSVRVHVADAGSPDAFGPTAAFPSPHATGAPSTLESPQRRAAPTLSGEPGPVAPLGVAPSFPPPAAVSHPPAAGQSFPPPAGVSHPPAPWPSAPQTTFVGDDPADLRRRRMLWGVLAGGAVLLFVLVLVVFVVAWAKLRQRAIADVRSAEESSDVDSGDGPDEEPGASGSDGTSGPLGSLTAEKIRKRLKREGYDISPNGSTERRTGPIHYVYVTFNRGRTSMGVVQMIRYQKVSIAEMAADSLRSNAHVAVRQEGRKILIVSAGSDSAAAEKLADALLR